MKNRLAHFFSNPIRAISIFFVFAIIFMLAILLYFAHIIDKSFMPMDTARAVGSIFEVSVDGGGFSDVPFPELSNCESSHICLRLRLKEDIPAGQSVYFYFKDCFATVYLNAQPQCEFGEKSKIFRSTGAGWLWIDSRGIASSDIFVVDMTACYNTLADSPMAFLQNIKAGTDGALYRTLIRENWFFIIISSFIISIGICAFLVSIFEKAFKLSDVKGFLVFGMVFMLCGLWMFVDSVGSYLSLLLPIPQLSVCLSALLSFLVPTAVVSSFIYILKTRPARMVFSIITALLLALVTAVLVLQLLHIRDFVELQLFFYIVLFALLPFVVGFVIYDQWKKPDRDSIVYCLSYAPMILGFIVEFFNIYVIKLLPAHSTLSICVLFTGIARIFIIANVARKRGRDKLLLEKLKTEVQEERVALMTSQLRPHFLYNTLSVISVLCTRDPQKARDTVITLAKYLRYNLDISAPREPITFESELKNIELYVQLEKMRFGNKINIRYCLEEKEFVLPPLAVQVMVENAINHGISKKEEGGTVVITTNRQDNVVTVTVQDDGVGFAPNQVTDSSRSHLGIQNVKTRLSDIMNGSLQIESELGKGTTVMLTIPQPEIPE